MQITCSNCQRQLNLPDDKVPQQAFALTCPACKSRIQVDPTQQAAAAGAGGLADVPPTGAPAAAAPAAAAPTAGPGGFEPLLSLRDLDKELLDQLFPMAGIVCLDGMSAEPYEAGLRLLGMTDVRQFSDVAAAAEDMLETEYAIMVVLTEKAAPPPCAPLKPLYDLPNSTRRDTFLALVASNVRSLDGQTAFYLQVNCLLNAQEVAKFPNYLQRALLYHLRHYRYWGIRAE